MNDAVSGVGPDSICWTKARVLKPGTVESGTLFTTFWVLSWRATILCLQSNWMLKISAKPVSSKLHACVADLKGVQDQIDCKFLNNWFF